jgi:hypothetical protein
MGVIARTVKGAAGPIAWAELDLERSGSRPARAWMSVAHGPVPRDARRQIVDEVLDEADRARVDRLEISIALGESDLLARLHQRCASVVTRPAGATCLVDVRLDPTRSTSQADPVPKQPDQVLEETR